MQFNFLKKTNPKPKNVTLNSTKLMPKVSMKSFQELQEEFKVNKNNQKLLQSLQKINVNSIEKLTNEKLQASDKKTQTKIQFETAQKPYIKHHKKTYSELLPKQLSTSVQSLEVDSQVKSKCNDSIRIQQQKKKKRLNIGTNKFNVGGVEKIKQNESSRLQVKLLKQKQTEQLEKLKQRLKIKDSQIEKLKKQVNQKQKQLQHLVISYQLEKEILSKQVEYYKSEVKSLKKQNIYTKNKNFDIVKQDKLKKKQNKKQLETKESQKLLQQISLKKMESFTEKSRSTISLLEDHSTFSTKYQYSKLKDQILELSKSKEAELNQKNEKLKLAELKYESLIKQNQEQLKLFLEQKEYFKLQFQNSEAKIRQLQHDFTSKIFQLKKINLQLQSNLLQKTQSHNQISKLLIAKTQQFQQFKLIKQNCLPPQNQFAANQNDLQQQIEKKNLYIISLQENIEKLNENLNKITMEQLQMTKYEDQLKGQNEKLQQQFNELLKSYVCITTIMQEKNIQLKMNLNEIELNKSQVIKLNQQVDQLKKSQILKQQKYKQLQQNFKNLQKQRQNQLNQLSVWKQKYQTQVKNNEDLMNQIRLWSAKIQQQDQKSKESTQELLKQILRLEEELQKKNYKLQSHESQYDDLYREYTEHQQIHEKVLQSQQKLEQRIQILESQLEKKDTYIETLNLQIQQHEQNKLLLQNKIGKQKQCECCNQLTKELNKLNQQFQSYKYCCQDKMNRIQDQNEELKNTVGRLRMMSKQQ